MDALIVSWKTSLVGVLALIIGSVLFYLGKIDWSQYIFFLGLFGLGIFSKDHNVTGGTIFQQTPKEIVAKLFH